ncbi:unnamed protein product [Owenia fusiformis]|uniref:Uncharacterized protein n=1 Tax=Owenia fusiformis TaxID=6347 RepID=A0A8S4NN56_OWEFU|nr:unnamed protein product [Owenia fusiformis]
MADYYLKRNLPGTKLEYMSLSRPDVTTDYFLSRVKPSKTPARLSYDKPYTGVGTSSYPMTFPGPSGHDKSYVSRFAQDPPYSPKSKWEKSEQSDKAFSTSSFDKPYRSERFYREKSHHSASSYDQTYPGAKSREKSYIISIEKDQPYRGTTSHDKSYPERDTKEKSSYSSRDDERPYSAKGSGDNTFRSSDIRPYSSTISYDKTFSNISRELDRPFSAPSSQDKAYSIIDDRPYSSITSHDTVYKIREDRPCTMVAQYVPTSSRSYRSTDKPPSGKSHASSIDSPYTGHYVSKRKLKSTAYKYEKYRQSKSLSRDQAGRVPLETSKSLDSSQVHWEKYLGVSDKHDDASTKPSGALLEHSSAIFEKAPEFIYSKYDYLKPESTYLMNTQKSRQFDADPIAYLNRKSSVRLASLKYETAVKSSNEPQTNKSSSNKPSRFKKQKEPLTRSMSLHSSAFYSLSGSASSYTKREKLTSSYKGSLSSYKPTKDRSITPVLEYHHRPYRESYSPPKDVTTRHRPYRDSNSPPKQDILGTLPDAPIARDVDKVARYKRRFEQKARDQHKPHTHKEQHLDHGERESRKTTRDFLPKRAKKHKHIDKPNVQKDEKADLEIKTITTKEPMEDDSLERKLKSYKALKESNYEAMEVEMIRTTKATRTKVMFDDESLERKPFDFKAFRETSMEEIEIKSYKMSSIERFEDDSLERKPAFDFKALKDALLSEDMDEIGVLNKMDMDKGFPYIITAK